MRVFVKEMKKQKDSKTIHVQGKHKTLAVEWEKKKELTHSHSHSFYYHFQAKTLSYQFLFPKPTDLSRNAMLLI